MFCVFFFPPGWIPSAVLLLRDRSGWEKPRALFFKLIYKTCCASAPSRGSAFLRTGCYNPLEGESERSFFFFFGKWTELFLDLQCHPAESWELPVMGLMQCLGKSRRVHMTQQNIQICIPISWEAGLISTYSAEGRWECWVEFVIGELKGIFFLKKKRLRGGEHLNHSGTFLLGYIPIRQTQTWQSYAIAQCQKHSPGMRDMWTWTPPAAPLYGPGGHLHYKHTGPGTICRAQDMFHRKRQGPER